MAVGFLYKKRSDFGLLACTQLVQMQWHILLGISEHSCKAYHDNKLAPVVSTKME